MMKKNESHEAVRESTLHFNGVKGITLIALVITIIVLLILAGVAIATLTGDNRIINKIRRFKRKECIFKSKRTSSNSDE